MKFFGWTWLDLAGPSHAVTVGGPSVWDAGPRFHGRPSVPRVVARRRFGLVGAGSEAGLWVAVGVTLAISQDEAERGSSRAGVEAERSFRAARYSSQAMRAATFCSWASQSRWRLRYSAESSARRGRAMSAESWCSDFDGCHNVSVFACNGSGMGRTNTVQP